MRPFESLRQTIQSRTPGVTVALAYLEATDPDLAECIRALAEQGVESIRVLPLFLAMGKHLRSDIPALAADVAGEFTELRIQFLAPLGEAPEFVDALERIAQRALTRT